MVKNPPANAGDTGSILGLGRSPEEGSILELGRSPGEENGNPTPSSILAWEIPWTEGSWWPTVHGIAKRVGHDLAAKQQQACKKIGGKESKQEEY